MKIIAQWNRNEVIITISETTRKQGFVEVRELPHSKPPCTRKGKDPFQIVLDYMILDVKRIT